MWYIIRHGETYHNKLKISQGQFASLLTLKGIKQAESIGKKLLEIEKNLSDYKIVVSPAARTRHTARIIHEVLGSELEIVREKLIWTRFKGEFEDKFKKDIFEKFPEEKVRKEKDRWNYIPLGGIESKKDQYLRTLKFIDKYKDTKNLIIVLHQGGSSMIREILQNKDEEYIKNAKRIHIQNKFYQWDGKKIKKIVGLKER